MDSRKNIATLAAFVVALGASAFVHAGHDRDEASDRGSSRSESNRNDSQHDWDRDEETRWGDDDDKDWGNSHDGKVFICHGTSSSRNPYVLIQVSSSARQAHYDHGDPVNFSDKGKGKCGPSTAPPAARPDVKLSLASDTILQNSGTTTATWSSTNATTCKLDDSTVATSGSATVGPYTSTGYKTITVTCTGPGGSDSDSETLRVKSAPALPTVDLSIAPVEIFVGEKAKLVWSSTNANSCKLTLSYHSTPISIDTSGSYWKGPYDSAGTRTYTVTCKNSGGASVSETVTLLVKDKVVAPPAPTVTLSFAASTIETGMTTTASWSSTNAATCSLNGSSAAISGSTSFGPYPTPQTLSVSLTCTGAGGTATESKVLTVVQAQVVELSACSRLDSGGQIYYWAVDYYPETGQFTGISGGGVGAISGTIQPAGDIMTAGRSLAFKVDELTGVPAGPSTIETFGPGPAALPHAWFATTVLIGTTNANVSMAFTPNAQCYLPGPR